jgi:hypothetical protein
MRKQNVITIVKPAAMMPFTPTTAQLEIIAEYAAAKMPMAVKEPI